MATKICVYAICKDEGKFVDQWFHNVMPADYIAVLDTGSTPDFYEHLLMIRDTVNKAVGYEKVIIDQKIIKPWRFDVARNESMKLIPADADLCLCTDFDELLADGWADVLRKVWKGEPRVLYQYAWTHTDTGLPAKIFTYDKCHANDGKHFWKYPVHECLSLGTIEQDLAEIPTAAHVVEPMPFLEHFPDPEKQRQASYRELLEIRAKEFPEENFSYTYLIAQLFWERKFKEVIEFGLNKAIPHCFPKKDADQATMPDLYLYIGDSYRAIGDLKHALEFHRMAISFLPEARDGYIGAAWDLIYLGDPVEAIRVMTDGLERTAHLHIWSEREFSWTYAPYMVFALAYFCIGRKEVAQEYRQLGEALGAPKDMYDNLLKDFKPVTLK